MTTPSVISHYYEGQGTLLCGVRGRDGVPAGLRPMGNVSELSLATTGEVTAVRRPVHGKLVDMDTYTRGTSIRLSAKLESMTARNLAMLTHGAYGDEAAASFTGVPVKGYFGALQPLPGMSPDSLVLNYGATPLTPYMDDTQPWDFRVSLGSAGVFINDGTRTPVDRISTLGVTPSSIDVEPSGAVRFTVLVPAGVTRGQRVMLVGFSELPLSALKGKAITIAQVTGVTLDVFLPGVTAGADLSAGRIVFDGIPLTATYGSAPYSRYTAAIDLGGEFYLRFDGMNLAEGGAPVTVEISRVKFDPNAMRDLLNDELAFVQLTGAVLYDRFRPLQPFYTERFAALSSDSTRDPPMPGTGFFLGWNGENPVPYEYDP